MNEYEKSKFEWLLTFENEATIKRYKSTLRKFDSFLLKNNYHLDNAKNLELTSLIREFFQDLSKSLASRDIKKRVSTAYDSHKYAFYSYLKFLQENNYINKIPKVYHPKTTKTKSYRGLSTEEVELILEYFENRFSSKELQGLSFMKRRQFLIDRLLFFSSN